MAEKYDVIIIGTGAGGGTLAHRLATNSKKKILILERGDYLRREKENWSAKAVFVDTRYKAHEEWYDKDGKPFHPGIQYYVGGNTKVYGAALFRLRERDFGEIQHHGGTSPAWPLSYDVMSPYYDEAEEMYQVHGKHGVDPTDPPANKPYPHPPVSHEPRIQQLHDDFKKLGLHPFPLPIGVMLNEQDFPHSKCIRCDTCDGFPCMVYAKSDAQVLAIDPIRQFPHVTLKTNTKAERLLTDSSGKKVTGVEVTENGETVTYSADVVVVSCGAVNSSALLLKSASEKHPNGLANSSDVVGRHYMCHNNSAFVAISTTPNPTKFQKTLGVNDFYFGADDFDYPLGHIQMLGKSQPAMFEADAPAITPGFALKELAEHALDFWITSEDLPDPNNRVVVGKDGAIHLHYTENNMEPHKRLQEKLKTILKDIGCKPHLIPRSIYLGKKIPLAGTAHQCGTVRFGNDPKSSALDIDCKAHDVDNLYVVDGSFFCSSGAVNPGLTIIANALRVGDHLLERMR